MVILVHHLVHLSQRAQIVHRSRTIGNCCVAVVAQWAIAQLWIVHHLVVQFYQCRIVADKEHAAYVVAVTAQVVQHGTLADA